MITANTCIVAYEGPSTTDREDIYSCAVCGAKWMLNPWETEGLACAGLPTGTYTVG